MKRDAYLLAGMLMLVASLQGCGAGDSGAVAGTDVPTPLVGPAGGSLDQTAPTITYTGFAVVQDQGSYSAKVVVFFSEDMDPSSINPQTIQVFDPHGKRVHGDVLYLGVTGVYTPTGLFQAKTEYTVHITTGARSLAGVPMSHEKMWKFTTPDPSELTGVVVTVASNLPAAYEMDVPLNSGVNVTFAQVMDPATVNESTVSVVDPSGIKMPGRVHYTGLTASFVPEVPFAPNTTYRGVVSAGVKSLGGIAMDGDYRWSFTTGEDLGTTPPQLMLSTPMDGDTNVDVDASIAVYFDEPMDTNSINTGSFTLVGPHGAQISGTVTYAGTAAVFIPDAPLAPQTVYTAMVAAGVSSSGGVQMGVDRQWSFTTGSFSSDGTAPTVLFSDPAPFAWGIATSAKVSIAFSGALDPTTVTTANITLTKPDGSQVAGSVSYQGYVAFFVPAAPLTQGVTYTVTVGAGIKSLDGVHMDAPTSWTFTTAEAF
jgi:hypothetical protein